MMELLILCWSVAKIKWIDGSSTEKDTVCFLREIHIVSIKSFIAALGKARIRWPKTGQFCNTHPDLVSLGSAVGQLKSRVVACRCSILFFHRPTSVHHGGGEAFSLTPYF